jgi:alkylation response protein AidB-like acyl-CoA dehydrogenase
MQILDGGRISTPRFTVGIAQARLRSGDQYAKERQQFGKQSRNFRRFNSTRPNGDANRMPRLLTLQAASLKDAGTNK